MKTIVFFVAIGSLFMSANFGAADHPVIVHEWGTFTCLQDDRGTAIKGINVDDEPVPRFVYDQGGVRVAAQYSTTKQSLGLPPYQNFASKGWIAGDPDVTMRLETPVVYLYPPKGQMPASVQPLQVHVDFHGGLLSQYYPYATLEGLPGNGIGMVREQGVLNGLTSGLTWKDVRLGSTGTPVATDDKVWTTPREVSAPVLEVPAQVYDGGSQSHTEAQAEHFLFYRGVGHLKSPVFLAANASGKPGDMLMGSYTFGGVEGLDAAWMVEIRPDGTCASRPVGDTITTDTKIVHFQATHFWQAISGFLWASNFSAAFTDADFSADNLVKLKASMQDMLVKEGLYPDEASAMLRTWELSYFKSPGLRLFYIVPRPWVDKVLPLQVTGAPTEITRVMVGRIELITDSQRQALARLAAGPCPNLEAVKNAASDALGKLSDDQRKAFYAGDRPLGELGISIPPLVRDYLSLGRFRDALIVHEQEEHPSAALAQFIKDNRLATNW